jgi:hypothetical protein
MSELDSATLDKLARAFHELYRNSQRSSGELTDAAQRPWSELSEDLRNSNRASAAAAPVQLAAMGLAIAPAGAPDAVSVLENAAVERAAEIEHERWMAHKVSSGWVYGPVRDDCADPPIHPSMVPWADLPETERDKDRVRIRRLPEVLATAGLAAVPSNTRK